MLDQIWNQLQEEFSFSFSKSSGPGGQHVNTTESRVTLSWAYTHSALLSDTQKGWIKNQLKTYINKEDVLSISREQSRSRLKNQQDCQSALKVLLQQALTPAKPRKKTKPSKSQKKKRLETKKKRSDTKKGRKKVDY